MASPPMSLPGPITLAPFQNTTAVPKGSGMVEKHFATHVMLNGQAFWQSGAVGLSGGQHGILSDMSAIVEAAAIIGAPMGVATGPTIRPTIATI